MAWISRPDLPSLAPPFSVVWDERGMDEEARPRCQLANRAGASTVSPEASASGAPAVPTHQLRKGLDVDRLLDVAGEPGVSEPCGGFLERHGREGDDRDRRRPRVAGE